MMFMLELLCDEDDNSLKQYGVQKLEYGWLQLRSEAIDYWSLYFIVYGKLYNAVYIVIFEIMKTKEHLTNENNNLWN